MAPPEHLKKLWVVLHADRNMIACLNASVAKDVTQPIGRRIKFSEGLDFTTPGHDEGGFVWLGCEM